MSDDLEIRPLDLLDPSQEPAARGWIGVHAAVQRDIFGDRGSAWTLEEVQGFVRGADKKRVAWAAWSGGEVVGALEVHLPLRDNLRSALLWLSVEPSLRGRGVGSALVAEAERVAAEHGRSTLLVETEWAEGRSDASEAFATARGYVVAQTVLRSEQALPADRAALTALVAAPGAEDYRLESWVDDMPEAWLEDRALLQQRMSTDAPSDDLDLEEEDWDVERLRASLARASASGRRAVETAARHLPSGRLVGFTTVGVSAGEPDLGYQQDTLVLREHRGHGLGLRLKAANALRVMDELPEVSAIRTWNAASNEHMLAVNRRLGYTVDGYSREWQKVVRVPE
ncbi:GNAT family N-acetyltransferase [Terrabacter aerolatus]|uniref:GNAT family N-acetyltransferase n=1 Tax=Terrabacter aerolatus TaxID=422442 RepID=A0A512D0N1_9MICO|nr:GNAT family N-acetyltransferase [Terrabacter aerolatus]GEO29820.1 GNAT family N-acetyltransferase [Terrabacter aerolatus]